ncbi:LysR family transcriptional regulator [Massilia orientalis]|jgi:DNA-binding transcriptional LysR family regulator|uniref:LysR family transcriptional regulator n=1 Tax=Massilia orientalis TaxID=3050128 RepID=A0ACC7MEH7_9BURK|nr:LysR family transcriptional regulator [Massilia sp. YIM B02787]
MDAAFDWNDIPLILALARGGSIATAARELGIDASTVSRRLGAAERRLKAKLFARDRGGLRLTEAGTAFVERAAPLAGNVHGMLLAASGADTALAGTVRISAIDFLFDHWLLAHLAALQARHPGLDVELQGNNGNVSFGRHEADLALRLARSGDEAVLTARRIGTVGWAVFGAPAFAGLVRADWGSRPWVVYDATLSHLPEMRWIAREVPMAARRVRTGSLSTMVQACRAGLGLALLPCILDCEPGLVRLDARVEVRRELWLASHRDAVGTRRIRVVGDWLAALCAADSDRLCRGAADSAESR